VNRRLLIRCNSPIIQIKKIRKISIDGPGSGWPDNKMGGEEHIYSTSPDIDRGYFRDA
jgi:hypothetical protein